MGEGGQRARAVVHLLWSMCSCEGWCRWVGGSGGNGWDSGAFWGSLGRFWGVLGRVLGRVCMGLGGLGAGFGGVLEGAGNIAKENIAKVCARGWQSSPIPIGIVGIRRGRVLSAKSLVLSGGDRVRGRQGIEIQGARSKKQEARRGTGRVAWWGVMAWGSLLLVFGSI